MKTKFIFISALALSLLVASCNEAPTSISDPYNNNNSTFNTGTTTGGTTGTTTGGTTGTTTGGTTGTTTGGTTGTTTGGTTGTTTGGTTGIGTQGTGSTCYGTTLDGDGSGDYPIFDYDIKRKGQDSWVPGGPNAPIITEVMYAMQSDTRYKVRFKILPQPSSCGQDPGPASYPYYSKVRLTLNFHTLKLKNDNSGDFVTPHELNPPFHSMYDLGPFDTNSCSDIINVPHLNVTGPVIIKVTNVKTDFECQYSGAAGNPAYQYYGWYCPAEQLARTQSCWNVKMQIANDITDDFQ
jgi:hypothetical protein